MDVKDLPAGKSKAALNFPHFPTKMQAVIWRNWNIVPAEKVAQILNTSCDTVISLAMDMGLSRDESLCPTWKTRGYLTIIRRNWHLLPYSQILELLDWTADEMAYILKEDDFLWGKLGKLKPETEPVYYRPLTAEEKQKTLKLKETIKKYFPKKENALEPPFEFLRHYGRLPQKTPDASSIRLAYSYSALYGDPLLDDTHSPYPDELLADYAAVGINAVWLQGILYTLIPWLGETSYSNGWEIRLANLKKLCQRAMKYGIKIYLYFNEPRSMPLDFFKLHPDWLGVKTIDEHAGTLCTSRKPVIDALQKGVCDLFRNVPELGGIFTISIGENLTTCCSKPLRDISGTCPICSELGVKKVTVEINRVLAEAIHSIKPEADVIVWTWGWSPEWIEEAIELLPKDIKLMCVSETDLSTSAMGIKGSVYDYSMSKVGPGPLALRIWEKARQCGIDVMAKVQLNNTWECSAVPYIPVPGLVEEHLHRLKAKGVNDLMLSWTLGGYPGGNFDLLSISKEKLAEKRYGSKASAKILKAWDFFDQAFSEFPLHQHYQLYYAPQNFGPMNLLFFRATGYTATMLGFPYDDLDMWRGNHYTEDIFEEQFRKLSEGWHKGLELLHEVIPQVPSESQSAYRDMLNIAEAAYCHFRSTYLQIRFIRLRGTNEQKAISTILNEEIELAQTLCQIIRRDSRIGFEASNHYYYTENDLCEKILNCEDLLSSC